MADSGQIGPAGENAPAAGADVSRSREGPLVITALERQKRSGQRYNIYINDEFAFAAHEDIVVKFRLLKGTVLSERKIAQIRDEEQRHGAYRAALRYIGRAMRSKKEVEDKLKALGYEQPVVAETVRKLAEQKWIDDGEYAAMLARQRLNLNKKGKLWVKRELALKGVERDQIEAALEPFDDESEYERAFSLALRRWERDNGEPRAKLRRLAGFLERRGFSPDTVRAVLRKMGDSGRDWAE